MIQTQLSTTLIINYPPEANELIDGIESKISVITRMELLSWPGANIQQTKILNEYIETSLVLSLEETIIQKTIDVRKAYKIKLPDAIIAATAIVNNYTLITRNTKDFQTINGLKLLNPYKII